MDEVFGRKDMISPARLRELTVKSDTAGYIQLGSHLGAIVATGALLYATWGTWVAVPLFIIHGTLINFLYAGQHEMSHWTVFKTKKLIRRRRNTGFVDRLPSSARHAAPSGILSLPT